MRVQAIHQYRPYVPTNTFWDDHKQKIWTLIIVAIFTSAIITLLQSSSLCGCAQPDNRIPESAEV
jgi:hypothetical protein